MVHYYRQRWKAFCLIVVLFVSLTIHTQWSSESTDESTPCWCCFNDAKMLAIAAFHCFSVFTSKGPVCPFLNMFQLITDFKLSISSSLTSISAHLGKKFGLCKSKIYQNKEYFLQNNILPQFLYFHIYNSSKITN